MPALAASQALPASNAASPHEVEDERNHQQHKKNVEDDLCDPGGCAGYASEAEHTGHDGDDEKE